MKSIRFLGSICLVLLVTACAPPRWFVIQSYPGEALPVSSALRVQSQNGWMTLRKVDGKTGKFEPFASGPGAYAGFDLRLLPGKHQLEVSCWIEPNPFAGAVYSDPMTIEVEGSAGEHLMISCTPENRRMRFDVHRVSAQ